MATKGTIKRLIADKGFGFVRDSASGTDYFFHRSENPSYDYLTEGQAVTFEVGDPGPKGPRATQVQAA